MKKTEIPFTLLLWVALQHNVTLAHPDQHWTIALGSAPIKASFYSTNNPVKTNELSPAAHT